jgi:hypothetical protein
MWYDGSTLALLYQEENEYSMVKVPDTIDAMLDHLIDNYEVPIPMADFFYGDVYKAFFDYLISGAYMGQRLVDGVVCHHLSFESTGVDWQLWVEVGEKPLPRRFVITYLNLRGEPEYFAGMTWDLNPQLDQAMFQFTPPEGAKEVPFGKALKQKREKQK